MSNGRVQHRRKMNVEDYTKIKALLDAGIDAVTTAKVTDRAWPTVSMIAKSSSFEHYRELREEKFRKLKELEARTDKVNELFGANKMSEQTANEEVETSANKDLCLRLSAIFAKAAENL
jgi:hypothetical protein